MHAQSQLFILFLYSFFGWDGQIAGQITNLNCASFPTPPPPGGGEILDLRLMRNYLRLWLDATVNIMLQTHVTIMSKTNRIIALEITSCKEKLHKISMSDKSLSLIHKQPPSKHILQLLKPYGCQTSVSNSGTSFSITKNIPLPPMTIHF